MEGYAFPSQNIENVVGNGRMIARAHAGSSRFIFTPVVQELSLLLDEQAVDTLPLDSLFRPGNAVYTVHDRAVITHAAAPDEDLYMVLIQSTAHEPQLVELYVTAPEVAVKRKVIHAANGRVVVSGKGAVVENVENKNSQGYIRLVMPPGERVVFYLGTDKAIKAHRRSDAFQLVATWEHGYRTKGLQLFTPDEQLNLAVDYMKYHLQLGYDWPEKMVCDVFRWRDVWSRDFGSGFGPGGIVANMYDAVLQTLEYELERHRKVRPSSYKVSDDTSQGGSVEGLGWLMKLIWRFYKHTGDLDFLARMYDAFEPWMKAWMDRDADDDGLVVDVTEWMDHSRFLRLPEGQRTLYSNALYYAALRRFSYCAQVLGKKTVSEHYRERASITRTAIHKAFWNEAGYFNNAVFWGVSDTALMLADNCITLMERVATQNESYRTLNTIRERNWRRFGSVTVDVPMKYIDLQNDHNMKVWPWWMALEARARFSYGDRPGAMHLIKQNIATMERTTFPGLMEEYLYPDDGGQDGVVGHAFMTAAGATLDALMYGLIGLSHREPGDKGIRLAPRAPREWETWSAKVDLYKGSFLFEKTPDAFRITLNKTRIEYLDVRIPPKQKVECAELNDHVVDVEVLEDPTSGAEELRFRVEPNTHSVIEINFLPMNVFADPMTRPVEIPPPFQVKQPALIDEPRLFADVLQLFVNNAVSYFGRIRHIAARQVSDFKGDILISVGNEMPFATKQGEPVQPLLDEFLASGRTLLLLGPRAGRIDPHTEGRMGERGGLFWWKRWKGGRWVDYDPYSNEVKDHPVHPGTVYWGDGPLFRAWEQQYGMFGFETECRGVFDIEGHEVDADQWIEIVYTDFAIRKPWKFHPLAFTERVHPLVTGPKPERYPCAALLHNTETDTRIVMIAPSICSRADLLRSVLSLVFVPAQLSVAV